MFTNIGQMWLHQTCRSVYTPVVWRHVRKMHVGFVYIDRDGNEAKVPNFSDRFISKKSRSNSECSVHLISIYLHHPSLHRLLKKQLAKFLIYFFLESAVCGGVFCCHVVHAREISRDRDKFECTAVRNRSVVSVMYMWWMPIVCQQWKSEVWIRLWSSCTD